MKDFTIRTGDNEHTKLVKQALLDYGVGLNGYKCDGDNVTYNIQGMKVRFWESLITPQPNTITLQQLQELSKPKDEYPKLMYVSEASDAKAIEGKKKREVILGVEDQYVARHPDIHKRLVVWRYAVDIPKELPKVEVSIQEIADLKGIKIEQVQIIN
jgi:hypothetical protein